MSQYFKDQTLATTEGHYSSRLVAKAKLLYYTITLNLVAGAGTFEIILGPATEKNLDEIAESIEDLENELKCFTQVVKDNYIDNMGNIEKLQKYRAPRIKKGV